MLSAIVNSLPFAVARIGLGVETMRCGFGKYNDFPHFQTMLRSEGGWGPAVIPQLQSLPEAATTVVAAVGTATQLGGGACLATGVLVRPVCLVLTCFMGVATHWQLVSRNRPASLLWTMKCDGKGVGPGYYVLGYGALLALGGGRFSLRLLRNIAPTGRP